MKLCVFITFLLPFLNPWAFAQGENTVSLEDPSECNLQPSSTTSHQDDFCALKIYKNNSTYVFSADALQGGKLKQNSQVWAKKIGKFLPDWSTKTHLAFELEGVYQSTLGVQQLFQSKASEAKLPFDLSNYDSNELLKDPMYQFEFKKGDPLAIIVDLIDPAFKNIHSPVSLKYMTPKSTVVVVQAARETIGLNDGCRIHAGDVVVGMVLTPKFNFEGTKAISLLLTKEVVSLEEKPHPTPIPCEAGKKMIFAAKDFRRLL